MQGAGCEFLQKKGEKLHLLPPPSTSLRRGLLPVQLRALVALPPAVVEDQRVVRVGRVPPAALDLGRRLLVELLAVAGLLVCLSLGLGLVLLLIISSAACSWGARWPRGGHLLIWREREGGKGLRKKG